MKEATELSTRWKGLVLAIVPGFGHLYLGRHWRGLAVFAVFAIAINGMYFAHEMASGQTAEHVFDLCRGGAAAMLAYSLLHVAYVSRQFERKSVAERKDYHFKLGQQQYVGGAFDEAKAEFLTVLKLDPIDIDARFWLGMSCRALGERREAAKSFRRCMADDLGGKWRWEVETQLKGLKEAP